MKVNHPSIILKRCFERCISHEEITMAMQTDSLLGNGCGDFQVHNVFPFSRSMYVCKTILQSQLK